jgi:hypothetical protein
MAGTGGIDRGSGVDDVRDSFARVGVELDVRRGEVGWQAFTVLNGSSHLAGSGDGPDEAARAAWAAYVRRNGGVGQS